MTLSGLDSPKSQQTKDIRTGGRCRRVWVQAVVPLLVTVVSAGGCQNAANQRQGRGAPSVAVRTTPVLRMSVQRQIDLAGTLLSPDQAKISAESAGVVRQVLVEIGTEVKVGHAARAPRDEGTGAGPRARGGVAAPDAGPARHARAARRQRAAAARRRDRDRQDRRPRTGTMREAAYERAKVLSDRGITSTEMLQVAETKYKVAEAAYEAALDSVHATKAHPAGSPGGVRPGGEGARTTRS